MTHVPHQKVQQNVASQPILPAWLRGLLAPNYSSGSDATGTGFVHTLSQVGRGVQNSLPHLWSGQLRSAKVDLQWRPHRSSGHGDILVKPWQGVSCHVAAGHMVRAKSASGGLQSWAGVSAGGVVRGAAALAQGGHLSCGLPLVRNHPARVGNAAPGPVSPLPVGALQA